MATLHLMVGLPCSGKSTLARTLEQEHAALRLTPDEWQLRLFGQDAEAPEHDARHTLIETLQWEVASRALALGINVILDYGFWAREERDLAQVARCISSMLESRSCFGAWRNETRNLRHWRSTSRKR